MSLTRVRNNEGCFKSFMEIQIDGVELKAFLKAQFSENSLLNGES